ncbi:MAG: DUF4159 domain-containing protein [Candidatus Poribacteria bacterium]|nr:DUF4159 domain-containing protein [Candidatus Poribacteria bacterium]MDE0503245.1 DUF4159 domain-containing protein [Candidatus Poribacteria bacterium]
MASTGRKRYPVSLFVSILLHLVLTLLLFRTITHEYGDEGAITLDWVKLPPEKRTVKTEVVKRPPPKTTEPKTLGIQRNLASPAPKPVEVKIDSSKSPVFAPQNLEISVTSPESGLTSLETEANLPAAAHSQKFRKAVRGSGAGNEGLLIGTVQQPSSEKGRSNSLSSSIIDSTGAVDSLDSEDADFSRGELVSKNKLGAVLLGKGSDLEGHIRLVRLRHSLSDWWQDPTALPSFMKWLAENSPLRADMNFKGGSLRMTDPDILYAPIVFMTGHDKDITVSRGLGKDGPLTGEFTPAERAALRTYVIERGGMFFFDDCGFNGLFAQQVALELDRIFPEYPLVNIPHDHEIYKIHYQLSAPPTGGDVFWGSENSPKTSKFKYQKGISIGRRLGVVFNRKDYMCSMETAEIESRTMLRMRRSPDVHRFMTNLLIYTMRYGGNTDRSNYKE